MKIEDCIFYSGGADGADTLWENALKEKGAKVIVYRPKHIDELGKEELEVLEEKYLEVVKKLGRKPMDINRFAGKLVRRDMLQEKDCESLYAIGTINKYNGLINGGTGYASTRAILNHKNVYLFEQEMVQWMEWSYEEEKFVKCQIKPVLDKRSTVVGTREINENGIKAINAIINRSFKDE